MSNDIYPSNAEQTPTYFVTNDADTFYLKSFAFSPGVYIINWPSGATLTFNIINTSSGNISSLNGSSAGYAYIGLNDTADIFNFKTDLANCPVGIKKVRSSRLTSGMVFETITSSTTYTETGYGYAVLVGAGGGGGGAYNANNGSYEVGGGGGSGEVVTTPFIEFTGSMSLVVGAGGAGSSAVGYATGFNGGDTTLDAYTAVGGSGGGTSFYNSFSTNGGNGGSGGGGGFNEAYAVNGTGGTGSTGSNGTNGDRLTRKGGNGGVTTIDLGLPVKAGTTGGGSAGTYTAAPNTVGGSGIGTGGLGGAVNFSGSASGQSGSGYGAGGGGAVSYSSSAGGGNGTDGVVYILRGSLV